MWNSSRTALATIVAVVGLAMLVPADDSPNQKKKTISIRFHDLNSSVTVLGKLDHPFGSALTIRGTWYRSSDEYKASEWRLRVDKVNGSALPEPVEFRFAELIQVERASMGDPIDGESWELRGFERCSMQGYPGQITREIAELRAGNGRPFYGQESPYAPRGRFVAEFVCFRATKLK